MCVYIHLYVYINVYVCIHKYTYICSYICQYVCMCVCIHVWDTMQVLNCLPSKCQCQTHQPVLVLHWLPPSRAQRLTHWPTESRPFSPHELGKNCRWLQIWLGWGGLCVTDERCLYRHKQNSGDGLKRKRSKGFPPAVSSVMKSFLDQGRSPPRKPPKNH